MCKISLQSNNAYDKIVEVGPIVGLYLTIAHHIAMLLVNIVVWSLAQITNHMELI
jgi:uncharacterized UPF0146 family protein